MTVAPTVKLTFEIACKQRPYEIETSKEKPPDEWIVRGLFNQSADAVPCLRNRGIFRRTSSSGRPPERNKRLDGISGTHAISVICVDHWFVPDAHSWMVHMD